MSKDLSAESASAHLFPGEFNMVKENDEKTLSVDGILANATTRMDKTLDVFKRELSAIRTGRASPALLENLTVDYYGVPTPLNQVASVTAQDARMVTVQPWDKGSLQNIERSLLQSDLGVNPSNDGNVIRVPIPPLTQERRLDLVKLLKRKAEDGKIALRNIRRDAMEQLRRMERDKQISQDDNRRAQDNLQKVTNAHISQTDETSSNKEVEIMQV